jgi:hypothetical protein
VEHRSAPRTWRWGIALKNVFSFTPSIRVHVTRTSPAHSRCQSEFRSRVTRGLNLLIAQWDFSFYWMKRLKTRLITIVWSLILITISGFSFNGCIKEPLQTGVQKSMGLQTTNSGGSNFRGEKEIYTRENAPFGYWGYTVGYSVFTLLLFGFGITSFIGGVRGTSSLAIGYIPKDNDDDDFQEALEHLKKIRAMKPKKRDKALREFLTLKQLRSGAPDEQEVKLDKAVDEIIAEARKAMTKEQQEEYLERIQPDEAKVQKLRQFYEKIGNPTKVKGGGPDLGGDDGD